MITGEFGAGRSDHFAQVSVVEVHSALRLDEVTITAAAGTGIGVVTGIQIDGQNRPAFDVSVVRSRVAVVAVRQQPS